MNHRQEDERREDLPNQDSPKQDFLEKRGFTWAALMVLLILTLIGGLVLAYLMTVRNIPAH